MRMTNEEHEERTRNEEQGTRNETRGTRKVEATYGLNRSARPFKYRLTHIPGRTRPALPSRCLLFAALAQWDWRVDTENGHGGGHTNKKTNRISKPIHYITINNYNISYAGIIYNI